MMYMNASPLGIIKKIAKIYFVFWLISFCMQKTGFSRIFAGGTWKRRRTAFADLKNQIWKATGINNTSEIGGKICRRCHWHRWQICRRCRWYRQQFCRLIPVVHLDLRISPRIFEKIWNGPNAILWGWGETDSSKKPEAKNLVTLSL